MLTTRRQNHRLAATARILLGLAAAVGVLGAAPAPALAQSAVSATPPVVVDPPVLDLGDVDTLEVVEGVFTLRNPTDRDLLIADARAACNCTTARIQSRVIPANGSTPLTMVVDLRGDVGPLKKPLSVFIQGYSNPITLQMQAVQQYPGVRVDNAPIRPTTLRQGTISLRSTDGRPFRVTRVQGEEPQIVVSNPPNAARYQQCVVRYDFSDEGVVPNLIVVETDHPDAPVIALRTHHVDISTTERPFHRQLRFISASRKSVNLGVLRPGESVEFDTIIRCEPTEEPIRAFFEGRDDLEVEVVKQERSTTEARAHHLVVRVTSNADEDGIIVEPLHFQSGDYTCRFWVAGVTKPAGETSAASGAGS